MVVTAVMYEVGVAVMDPVPVPDKFTLLRVCAVTEPPPPSLLRDSMGEFEAGVKGVVRGVVKVGPEVHTASVFISSVWLFSNWLAWSRADILSREETLLVTLSCFSFWEKSFVPVCAMGDMVRSGRVFM